MASKTSLIWIWYRVLKKINDFHNKRLMSLKLDSNHHCAFRKLPPPTYMRAHTSFWLAHLTIMTLHSILKPKFPIGILTDDVGNVLFKKESNQSRRNQGEEEGAFAFLCQFFVNKLYSNLLYEITLFYSMPPQIS